MSDKKNPKVEWGYFAVTPRILRTQYKQLSHTEKWLYTCLKDLCGDKGMCFRTLRVLSQETDLSIGNLSIGIRHLHEAGLIHAEKKRRSNNPTAKEVWHISIVDIWKSNVEYCSNFEHSAENVQGMNNNVQNLNNPPLERSISEQKRSNFDDRRNTTEEQQFEERTDEEQVGVSADASTPPAFYSSQEIPVTYNEALAYLKPHGPHEGLDAVQVMKLAQKLWAEAHEEDGSLTETSYHIAESTIGNDTETGVFVREEDAPTVKMPAIKLNGASHAPVVDHLPADRGSTSVVSRSGVPGSDGIQQPGQSDRHAEVPADTQGGRQATTALQVQPQTQEITQQTPGPGALPSAADPPQFGRSHGITSDQAISAPLVSPEPAQAAFPPAGSVASSVPTAQASGARSKPEKPVQQALGTTAEGNVAQEKETAKQKKARLERRRDEIIALHCQLLGRNVVRSKDELEGARLMAEAGSTDAEITLTYNAYKNHGFWGKQLHLKNIAKLLDTTVPRDGKRDVDTDEIADDDYSITAMLKIQERRERRAATERGV